MKAWGLPMKRPIKTYPDTDTGMTCCAEKDWANCRIFVHALKSASRSIGADVNYEMHE